MKTNKLYEAKPNYFSLRWFLIILNTFIIYKYSINVCIFNDRISPPHPPQPAAYSQYWTRYNNQCIKQNNTFFQLNMKRKALTLQYNITQTQLKQTSLHIKAVKNQNRISNRYLSGLINTPKCSRNFSGSVSQSNVPGDKSFIYTNLLMFQYMLYT